MRARDFRLKAIMLLTTALAAPLFGQDKPAGKVHGYVFGDYFYKLHGDSLQVSSTQYSKVAKDFQAFQFRRLYLYYDHTISEKFFAQFLLEGTDKSLDTSGRYAMYIKAAYLEWKNIIPRGSAALGLYPTPAWAWLTEKVWNYRSVEKTIADFRGMGGAGGATDLGIVLRGQFDAGGRFGYGAMIGNGSGQKPEGNKYKKYYGALNARPVKTVTLEAYADYEPGATDKNISTLKGFAAYQVSRFTAGIEAVYQTQENAGPASADKTPFGVAFFAWGPVPSVDKLNAFARLDFSNPNTQVADSGFNEYFFVAGLDYTPVKHVHFMPNFWLNSFSDKSPAGVKKEADMVVRMTFYYIYE